MGLEGVVKARPRMNNLKLVVTLFALLSGIRTATAKSPATPQFARDVAPILNKYCAGCHNADDQEGGLSLESFLGVQQGGEQGPSVLPGQADSSRLIRMLTGAAEPKMPPEDNEAPTAEEVELLRAWINNGARGPDGHELAQHDLITPVITSQRVGDLPISDLAYSPNGEVLAIARFRAVEIRSGDGKSVINKLTGHSGKVNAVQFTADGRYLLAASGISGLFGEVRIWDVATWTLAQSLSGHRDTLYAAVPSPDGRWLATAGYDRLIILWDLSAGKQIRTFSGHNGAVFDLAFSPDSTVLASASADQTVKLWHVATGDRLDTLSQPLKEQYTVAFAPDGLSVVAAGVDNRLRAWDFVSRDRPRINPIRLARFAHEGSIVDLQFSTDGTRLVTAAEDRSIKVWDTTEFNEIRLIDGQSDLPSAVAVVPNGDRFAVGRLDGSLEVYPMAGPSTKESTASINESVSQKPIVEIAALTEIVESEPNDLPEQARMVSLPCQIQGAIDPIGDADSDRDLFRFSSRAGQIWIVEVDAARSKSPLDSLVEILDEEGRPVLRALLQAVRDSYVEFRGGSSEQTGVRLHNWEEMELNDLLYRKGEINKLFRMPRGPDSDILMYASGGKRRCYLDTTATVYALHEPCYIVRRIQPDETVVPNGLPVFPIYFENDDDASRKLGNDSRLTFVTPADGEYLVRIRDLRGDGGPEFKYRMTIRPPDPNYHVTVHNIDLTVSPGSGKAFRVSVERIDGFDGAVRIDFDEQPAGFHVTSPIVIQAGHDEAFGMVFAEPGAPKSPKPNNATIRVSSTVTIGDVLISRTANSLGQVKLGDKPKIRVHVTRTDEPIETAQSMSPMELTIAPGETITADLHIERLDFDERVTFEARNLPHGVIIDHIGLNGVLIPEGQTTRTIFLSCAEWVPETTRTFFLRSNEAGNQTSRPLTLHVRRP